MNTQAEQIARMLDETRAATIELFDTARESDLHESPGFGFRPVIWHLAHIGVFEAYWLLQKVAGEASPDQRYENIFDPIATPREESKNLPSRREMETYLERVRAGSRRVLENFQFDAPDPLLRDGYIFHLVLEHERQHQETLAYLLQLLDPLKKTRPAVAVQQAAGAHVTSFQTSNAPDSNAPSPPHDMIAVPAGDFVLGATWNAFAYDNEMPSQTIFIPAYKIARVPTTNEEYARFVAERGYERREFWSAEGWTWREREDWTCPLYWCQAEDEGWSVRGMFESGTLAPDHPVTGVSWYEAEAYARFMSKRLPTESQWEKAASWDFARKVKRRFAWGDEEPTAAHCNFNSLYWGTTPVGAFPAGASDAGCLDMTGNVWEWTNDEFAGFPGFKPFPYPEYSEEWFDGDHRILKGGSWATRSSILRTSFRNFFRRHLRIAFAGIRLAEDA